MLHHDRVGGVNDEWGLYHLDGRAEEALDVLDLVPVGVGEAHVDQLRPGAHLRASHLGCFLIGLAGDEPLELATADDIGALADDERAVRLLALDVLDAAEVRRQRARRNLPRLAGVRHIRDGAGVLRRAAAAAANDVEPALRDEARERSAHERRGFRVVTELVG